MGTKQWHTGKRNGWVRVVRAVASVQLLCIVGLLFAAHGASAASPAMPSVRHLSILLHKEITREHKNILDFWDTSKHDVRNHNISNI